MENRGTLTYDDLAAMPNDGLRRELIDGELIVSPAPRVRHQLILGNLHGPIWAHIKANGGAQVFMAPCDVVFSDSDVVEPDLLVVAGDQFDILTEKNVQGAPALVVEVLSSDVRYDRVRKRDLYARAGVPRYWIVDPEADRIEVLRLQGDRYGRPDIFQTGDVLELDILPGLRIDVRQVFEL